LGAGPTSSWCTYADRRYVTGENCKTDCTWDVTTCFGGNSAGATEYYLNCGSDGIWRAYSLNTGAHVCGCSMSSC
jgi:hypothetical protein